MRNTLAILLGLTLAIGAALAADMPTFINLDADGNGELSQAEAAMAGVDLETADRDESGTLSQEEYHAIVEKMDSDG